MATEEKNLAESIELGDNTKVQPYAFGKNPYKDNPEWWTSSSMLIGIHVWIYRIRKVDVVNENFLAEIRLALTWEGTENDFNEFNKFKTEENIDQEQFKHGSNNSYNPFNDLVFHNGLIGDTLKIDSGVLKVGALGTNGQEIKKTLWQYENYVVYKLECEFFEPFELENFPLDSQDLQITIQLKKRKNVQNFCPFVGIFDFPSGLNAGDSNLTEYNVTGMKFEIYDLNFDGQLAVYNFCNFRVKIQRKYGVYMSKIVFLMFLTTLAAFLVFTMDDGDLADKYGLLVTLLLAAVAVQFVVGTYVPNLPYLTYLDYYVLMSFVIVFLVGFLVAMEVILDLSETVNRIIAIVSIVMFVIMQLAFLIWGIYARKRENRKLDFDRWDYVKYGFESDNVTIVGQDQASIDNYTKEMIGKYEWGKDLDKKAVVVKGD